VPKKCLVFGIMDVSIALCVCGDGRGTGHWGLNSGLHTCKTGAIPPVHFALVVLEMGLENYLPPHLSFLNC
jgi:hypothetical protein